MIHTQIFIVFVAKMIQSESPLLRHFAGMYTFGQPKVGDAEFSRSFYPEISCKIFHHAYNNGEFMLTFFHQQCSLITIKYRYRCTCASMVLQL